MRITVIGGSGHIGTYLVPRLVQGGHEVVSVSRGQAVPYAPNGLWKWVEKVAIDRDREEKDGTFGAKIGDLKSDVVIDLINFSLESTRQIVRALEGHVQHYLYCGSIWAHGGATLVPAPEALPRRPFGEYGIAKAASEAYLLDRARSGRFPATVVLPGHITGPGWNCINPSGNFDPEVFGKLARGEEILIPHFGMETVHHVHADDVAQVFENSVIHRRNAVGESFHAVAPAAMTLKGFAEGVAAWFGRSANVKLLPWQDWCAAVGREDYIESTYNHIAHSDNYSIEKGRRLIDYKPRYSILQAVRECVDSMIARGVIDVGTEGSPHEEVHEST